MTITSLMDDYCPSRYFQGEHGLSLYVETDQTRLLFDTGQTSAFLNNADRLGIDLDRLDAVVLSHGHYDHGGGLLSLYTRLAVDPPPLFAGRGFSTRRFSCAGSAEKDIGLSSPFLPERAFSALEVETLENPGPGIFLLPYAERIYDTWIDPRFVAGEGDARRPDLFTDELSLVVTGDSGLVIITGCAHRGISNIVEAARLAFPGRPVEAIVGGFHLANCRDKDLANAVNALKACSPHSLHCAHCTGLRGFAALSAVLPDRVSWLPCGSSIKL